MLQFHASFSSMEPAAQRYLAAQGLSAACSWGTRFAVAWWVFRLSHSNWMLGLAAFLGQGFALLLIPMAGALADAVGRKRLYLITQVASMGQVLLLTLLACNGEGKLRWLLLLCAVRGILFAVEQPARDGFIADLVAPEHLRETVVLQSTLLQLGRMIGPAAAGLLIQWRGEWTCFALDALSYLPLLVLLWQMPALVPADSSKDVRCGWWKELLAGWKIVCGASVLCQAVFQLAVLNLLGLPLLTVLPAFVREAMHGGPLELSVLVLASGFGAILANYTLGKIVRKEELECFLLPAFLATGFALMLISVAVRPLVAVLAMLLCGFAAMLQISATNILLQTCCGAESRGRVMAVYGVAFWGVAPFGSLLMGKMASVVGIRPCLFGYGLVSLAIGQIALVCLHVPLPLRRRQKWAVAALEESRYAGL